MFMFNVSCTSGQFSTLRLFLTLSVKSCCLELLHLHWIPSSMSERRSFNIFIFRKCKKLLRENFGKWPVWWVKIICTAKKLAALCAGTRRKADVQQFSLNALPQIPQDHLVELGTDILNLGDEFTMHDPVNFDRKCSWLPFNSLLRGCGFFTWRLKKRQWSSTKMHCSQFETANDLCFLCKCQICAERTVQVVRITSRKSSCTESCLDMTEKMTLNGRLAKFKSRKAVNPCSASSVFNAHSTKHLTVRSSVTWIFRVKNSKITANSTESHLRLKKTSVYFPQ